MTERPGRHRAHAQSYSLRSKLAVLAVLAERRRNRPERRVAGIATGTPSHDFVSAPPSLDQETNWVVSGGGLVGDLSAPSAKARPSR